MSKPEDIAEARSLLERAERESDPQLEARLITEALDLLEALRDDATPDENVLIRNIRLSYARRLLGRLPKLKKVPFGVWFSYFSVRVKLDPEVKELAASDPALAESHDNFVAMWRADLLRVLEKQKTG